MSAQENRRAILAYAGHHGGVISSSEIWRNGWGLRNADLIVHSQLQPANGDPVTFNYLMRNVGGDWKAEDVYLDGTISQLAVRRSEFTAILASEGADGLLTKLKAQSDGLLKSA